MMKHMIQTDTHNFSAIEEICNRVAYSHNCEIRPGFAIGSVNCHIVATCNGAALRDLVKELDRQGYLE